MPKIATDWNSNPSSSSAQYTYNSASIRYNDTVHTYSGVLVPIPDFLGKIASDWNTTPKTAIDWNANPAFYTNQRPYDGTNLYDSTDTYDGVVAGQNSTNTKIASDWNYA